MGSELWLGDERVWPNIKLMIKNPEIFRLPAEVPLEPRGVMNEIVIVPNLVKIEQCNRLGDYLVEELGYQREVDYLEFAYDWRYDVRRAARKLAEAIDNWGVSLPITLIGYSLGTLVSRYYVEHYGGKSKVERLILLGGPHHGVPKAATSLLLGPKILPFGMMGKDYEMSSPPLNPTTRFCPPTRVSSTNMARKSTSWRTNRGSRMISARCCAPGGNFAASWAPIQACRRSPFSVTA